MARQCWATSIGGCKEGLTREHSVSKSVLKQIEKLEVVGLPWCPEPKVVGIESFTVKGLCRHHNEQLSPVDKEASLAFGLLEQMARRHREITRNGRRQPVRRYDIDGVKLERWLIKTAINLCYLGELPIGVHGKNGLPDEALVKAAFGQRRLAAPAGLYWLQERFEPGRYVEFQPKLFKRWNQPLYVVGATFAFAGYPFFISLIPEPRLVRGDPKLVRAKHRPSRFELVRPNSGFVRIRW